MLDFQYRFLELILQYQQSILKFGEFTLKSGRHSPYFFQAGALNDGRSLAIVGDCLAAAIVHYRLELDGLFGPAYKGIPMVTATAIALNNKYQHNHPWSFNRKVAKDHGERGSLVGAPINGKVLIIDDVLTAGTAITESVRLIESQGARACGVLTLMDRCERTYEQLSASQWISQQWSIPVFSLISIYDLIAHLKQTNDPQLLRYSELIDEHLQTFGSDYPA